jgi:hypothetical protein
MPALGWKLCVLAWIDVIIILGAAFYRVELRAPFFWIAVVTSFLGSLLALIVAAYEGSGRLGAWSIAAFTVLQWYLNPWGVGP